MRYLFPFLLLVSLFATTTTANASNKPILQIDPGGHQAVINDIVFTQDGKQLVPASDDKVIRVWDIESGKTVRTIRGQVGEGSEGKIFAMALSPNGRWLAVGGWMRDDEIRLYDFESGELVSLLKGHTNVVNTLAFSPDSRLLISGDGSDYSPTAILWKIPPTPPAKISPVYKLHGHTGHIYAVAFTPDSRRVVTGSLDHTLRLWDVTSGDLIHEMQGHDDKVRSVAVSSTTGVIASGSWDHTIRLWDGNTGKFIRQLADQQANASSLAFSSDGKYLLSGVGSQGANYYCHIWSIPDGKEIVTYKKHDNIVLATAISPDGQWAVTGGGNKREIHIWNLRTGELKQKLTGVGNTIWAVGFSDDGKRIGWGKTWEQHNPAKGYGTPEYSLTLPTHDQLLGRPQTIQNLSNFRRAQDAWGDWSLRTRSGRTGYDAVLEIYKNENIQAQIERGSTDGYRHRSYTFTPDGKTVIGSASHGVLTAYTRTGEKLGDFVGHTGDVFAVAVSPDGTKLVSGAADQTVRLWDITTRELLLTIFHGNNDEWVAWTPEGFYAASPNGGQMVIYHINKGAENAAEAYTLDQVGESFYRPDLVAAKVLGGRLNRDKIAAALAKIGDIETLVAGGAPPEIHNLRIVQNQPGSREVTVEFEVRERNGGIGAIDFRVNGQPREIPKRRGLKVVGEPGTIHSYSAKVTLPDGENKFSIAVRNAQNQLLSKRTTQQVSVDDPANKLRKPSLYALVIGISDYEDHAFKLDFAADDAWAIKKALEKHSEPLFEQVRVHILPDEMATKTNIQQTFGVLAKKAQPEDVFVLYLAGHGMAAETKNGDYYFIPQEALFTGEKALLRASLSADELVELLRPIQAKKSLLLLDSCSADTFGKTLTKLAYNTRTSAGDKAAIDRLMRATGITVLAATKDKQQAVEESETQGSGKGHGIFTSALLEGIKGNADGFTEDGAGARNGRITTNELWEYVKDRVPAITEKRFAYKQIPMRESRDSGFAISCARGYEKTGCAR